LRRGSPGRYRIVHRKCAQSRAPRSINSKGVIAGFYEYYLANGSVGTATFLRSSSGNIMTFVPPPGSETFGVAFGINRAGAVTGQYSGDDNVIRGYLRTP